MSGPARCAGACATAATTASAVAGYPQGPSTAVPLLKVRILSRLPLHFELQFTPATTTDEESCYAAVHHQVCKSQLGF